MPGQGLSGAFLLPWTSSHQMNVGTVGASRHFASTRLDTPGQIKKYSKPEAITELIARSLLKFVPFVLHGEEFRPSLQK